MLKTSRKKYDVFLSFRGIDVRKTFVDHFFQSLADAGINAYLDERSMKTEKSIEDALKQTIDDSDICIIISSTNYASSALCLQELTHMCNSKAAIEPLFYDVHLHQVRHVHSQSKPAGEPSANSEYRAEDQREAGAEGKSETNCCERGYLLYSIDEWGRSLKEVSNINGWTRKITAVIKPLFCNVETSASDEAIAG
ncbi:hypothetical protein SUGI_0337220 [Cryptomeria japonica]|nr:hypothetical protein SUGI_0337220 [Cryptomeria japonica]